MTMNTRPTEPIWDKDKHEWVFYYTVVDKDAGKYKQVVRAETLLAAQNMISFINEKVK